MRIFSHGDGRRHIRFPWLLITETHEADICRISCEALKTLQARRGAGLYSSRQGLIWPQGAVTNSMWTHFYNKRQTSSLMYVSNCLKSCVRIFQGGSYIRFSHMVSVSFPVKVQTRVFHEIRNGGQASHLLESFLINKNRLENPCCEKTSYILCVCVCVSYGGVYCAHQGCCPARRARGLRHRFFQAGH